MSPIGRALEESGATEPVGFALDVVVLGRPFRLIGRHPATRDALARQWSRCRPIDASPGRTPPEEIREVPVRDREDYPADGGYSLTTTLTAAAIEQHVGRRLMFHAAGLATDDGRVVALIAPSGHGKTTAATTLCADRFGYVTDETVSVGDDLSVEAYPKPLSVVTDPKRPYSKAQHSPDDLGLRQCPEHLVLDRMIVLDRREDADPPAVRPLDGAEALMAVMPQISALTSLPRPLERLCRTIDRCGGLLQLSYRQIGQAAPLVSDLTARPAVATDPNWELWHPPGGRPAAWTDAVVFGAGDQPAQGAVVLVGRVPVGLGPLGVAVVEAALAGLGGEELVAGIVDLAGPHPRAAELVGQLAEDLRRAGVIPHP